MGSTICSFRSVDPRVVLPKRRQKLVIPAHCIARIATVRVQDILSVVRFWEAIVVTKSSVDRDPAKPGLESFVGHHLLVLDIRLAQLIVIIMGNNISCENGEGNIAGIEELRHGGEG